MGLADQILAANDLNHKVIEVPEWGVSVAVRTMTAEEGDELAIEYANAKEPSEFKNVRCKTVARGLVDPETKELLFPGDKYKLLAQKSNAVITRLFEAVTQLNKMGSDQVEEAAKNSEATHGGSSTAE